MAFQTRTVREALEQANVRLVPLQADARLTAAERALCGELEQANTLAINAMNAQNTIPPGQRNARAQQIEDKVFALKTVDEQHQHTLSPNELYNAMDLSMDSAAQIRIGSPSFTTDLGPGL